MPVLSQTANICWIEVQQRRIKVYDDEKTQSVKICTPNNTDGEYEQVFYFRGKFRVFPQDVDKRDDLASLTEWLRKRSYAQSQQLTA